MKINIETIPHKEQRYRTSGDYYLDKDGTYQIRISSLSTQKREMAVALHEIWEMFEAIVAGVAFHTIDQFDQAFTKKNNIDEPGDDPQAPYYRQHQKATIAERLFIEDVGDNWQEYEKEVDDL